METNDQKSGKETKDSIPEVSAEKQTNKTGKKKPRQMKKKGISASTAAAMGRSAVSQVRGNAYKDTHFMDTGTNLSYWE